jgi:hypothetical protein
MDDAHDFSFAVLIVSEAMIAAVLAMVCRLDVAAEITAVDLGNITRASIPRMNGPGGRPHSLSTNCENARSLMLNWRSVSKGLV